MAADTICTIPNCGKPHLTLGFCRSHHQQAVRWGTLEQGRVPSVAEAFESQFIPEPNSGCWIWIGNKFSEKRSGYGCFTYRPEGIVGARAHRFSWSLYRGQITQDEHVLHKCDNPLCVNPDHLFLGDQPANMADKVKKGRQPRGEAHSRRKLTEDQACKILADPRPYLQIAKDFNVTAVTVSNIKCARSWKHLGGVNRRYRRAA